MTPKEEALSLGLTIDGRWSDARIAEEIEKTKAPKENPFESLDWATTHAAKIWEGQSDSLTLIERSGRIRVALKAKGFKDFDSLKLPNPEAEQYL